MLVRILTGLIGIPIFLGLIYIGSWPFFVLVAGMGLIGFHEYARLWRVKGVQPAYVLGSLACLAIYVWAFLRPESPVWLGAILAGTTMAALGWLLLNYQLVNIVDALVTVAGVVYVGFLLSHFLLLRGLGDGTGLDRGLRWLIFALFCTWVADSAAYFVGISFGRRKLAPLISPGKSVEGVLGGNAGGVVVGWFMAPLVGIAPWAGGLLGLLISIISVMGDLAESALKRYAGVKDSGVLLPGHGGILDRFDSSLFVIPFVYYVTRILFPS